MMKAMLGRLLSKQKKVPSKQTELEKLSVVPDDGSGRMWMLFKLWSGKITSLALDHKHNLYCVKKGTLYKLLKGRLLKINTRSDRVVDVASDSKGNLYICSQDQVEILQFEADTTETMFWDSNMNFKSISVDKKDNVYLLGDKGRGNQAFCLKDYFVVNLAEDRINKQFAVDSERNVFFGRFTINNLGMVPLSGLYGETVNCIAVDNYDNAYFGTENGMFVVIAGSYEAKRLTSVNVKRISSISFSDRGHIYISSVDPKFGGIYILRA